MFLFGGGKSKGREQEPVAQPSGLHSSDALISSAAANALAAAPSTSDAVKAAAPRTGRRISGREIVLQLDVLHANEAVLELKVQPITLLKFDLKHEQTQQVAVSDDYICYGLRQGHIRALDRNTGGRALFKGHPAAISCMAFFSPSNNLLASVSQQGDITVRHLKKALGGSPDAAIEGEIHMAAQLPMQGAAIAPFAPVTLAWHPTVPQILAAGAGTGVHIYEVPTNAPAGVNVPPLSTPGISYSIPAAVSSSGSAAAVTAVAFTPTGDLLLAGDSAGSVHTWWLEGDEPSDAPLMSWQPFADVASSTDDSSGLGSLSVLHQAADGSSLLLTGNASNSTLKLWALTPAATAASAGGQPPLLVQTIALSDSKSRDGVFCHVAVQPEEQLVLLADTNRKQVYTLQYTLASDSSTGGQGANGAGPSTACAAFNYAAFFAVKQPILSLACIPDEADSPQLLLYCVQTDAIQQYMLNTALCTAAPDAELLAAEEALASADTSSGPASGAVTSGAADVSVAAEAAACDADTAVPAVAGADAEVPPPAQLPTPALLASRASSHSKAASADSSSTFEAKTSEMSAAAAVPQAAEVDTAVVAALQPAAEVTQQPMQDATEAEGSSTTMAAAGADGSAPLPPMPTTSLMHSAEKAAAAAPDGVAAVTVAGDDTAGSATAAESQPLGLRALAQEGHVPSPAVGNAIAADSKGPAGVAANALASAAAAEPATAAAVPPAAPGVTAADVAALQQQMAQLLQLQESMATQLQSATQQTIAGVKSELGRGLKSTEASLLKQVEAAIKASAKKAEDDRRKGAAKERQELERIMGEQLLQLGAALQRDLSKVVLDAARDQARAAVNATVNAVTPAVATAVASSLQQELSIAAGTGGSLQAVLEQALASSLAGPLHEALRHNFDASLIPAFERATRVMFSQVESAFNAWLADSSKAVSAAQAEASSSLSSTLGQLQVLVGTMRTDLADTSRSLSKLASTAASAAAERQTAAAGQAGGAAGGNAGGGGAAGTGLARGSGSGGVSVQQDPRAEIGALLASHQMQGALVKALNTASLDVLLWTCKQMDPSQVLSSPSSSLSQTTLLSLVHQLSVNLRSDSDAPLKLSWLAEAAPAIDPHDPVTESHLRGVLTGVMSSLKQLVLSLPQTDALAKQGKVTLHLFNSLLHQ